MAKTNVGRYEQLAGRTLAIKGPGTFGHVQDEIMGVLPLDKNAPVDHWYPQGINRYAAHIYQAAVAGEHAFIQIINQTEDEIWTIEGFTLKPQANQLIGIARNLTVPSTPITGTYVNAISLDTRQPTQLNFAAPFGTTVNSPEVGWTFITRWQWQVADNRWYSYRQVLGPGGDFCLYLTVANNNAYFTVWFNTRKALPGELS